MRIEIDFKQRCWKNPAKRIWASFGRKSVLCTWLFCLCFLASVLSFAQEVPADAYIEISAELEKKLDFAAQKQAQEDKVEAFHLYKRILGTGADSSHPLYFPEISYALQLQKAAENLSLKENLSDGYIEEIFRKSSILISPEEYKLFQENREKKGLVAAWKNLASSSTYGLYLGAEETVRKRILSIDKDSFSSLQKAEYERERESFRTLLKNKDLVGMYEFTLQKPLHAREGWPILGDIYFAQGEFSRAIGLWKRTLLLFPQMPTKEQMELEARIAMASWMEGDRESFARIKRKKASSPIQFKGSEIAFDQFLSHVSKGTFPPPSQDWLEWGGNPAHSKAFPPTDLRNIEIPSTGIKHHSYSIAPGKNSHSRTIVFPSFWDGKFLYNTPEGACGIDFASGKKWLASNSNETGTSTSSPSISTGIVYGGRYYYFSHPGGSDLLRHRLGGMQDVAPSHNFIFCVDANTGSRIWQWPDSSAEKNKVFYGTPILANDRLYVAAVVLSGQVNAELFCFDVSQPFPQLLWNRFICSYFPKSSQAINRLAPIQQDGGSIAAAYGMIYYCTNLGVIAAVDMENGEIRWLAKYHKHGSESRYRLRPHTPYRGGQFLHAPSSGIQWYNTPPIVKNGRLYSTPIDSEQMFIYCAFTGTLQKVYPDAQDNVKWTHILGVAQDGKILLGGPMEITAVQMEGEREVAWKLPISALQSKIEWKAEGGNAHGVSESVFSGMGTISERWLWVPFSTTGWTIRPVACRIAQIDLKNGKVQKTIALPSIEKAPLRAGHKRQSVWNEELSLVIVQSGKEKYLAISGKTRCILAKIQD